MVLHMQQRESGQTVSKEPHDAKPKHALTQTRSLLARKWLTVVPSESGARQDIAITEAGEAMVFKIKPIWKRAQRRVHQELGESVRSSLAEILALLHKLDAR